MKQENNKINEIIEKEIPDEEIDINCMKFPIKIEFWKSEDGLTVLRSWSRKGLTKTHIAKLIGINRNTLHNWIKKHDCIKEALERYSYIVNSEVEDSLFKICRGYEYTEEALGTKKTITYENGKKIEKVESIPIELKKYAHPVVSAIIFWLKNKVKEDWKDKPVETNDGIEKLNENMMNIYNLLSNPVENRKKGLEDE